MSPVSAADERDSSEVLLEDAVKRQGFQGVGLQANVGAEAQPLAHCGGCMGQTWVLGLGGLPEEQDEAGKKERRRWDERMGSTRRLEDKMHSQDRQSHRSKRRLEVLCMVP